MLPEEQPLLKSWRKKDKEIDEFIFTWTRWKNWEEHPPIVVLSSGEIAGYHAVSFTKTGYTNSASQFVLPEYRGKRFAGAMIDFLLKESHKRGMKRLRFRTPTEGPGLECWKGFGVEPFAEGDGDYWFDLSIYGIKNLKDFMAVSSELHLQPTEDKRKRGFYRKNNLKILVPAWEKINET
jgi:GNAT superfamily N-acetyltransferase